MGHRRRSITAALLMAATMMSAPVTHAAVSTRPAEGVKSEEAGGSAPTPGPRTGDLRVQRTAKGSIAIVKDNLRSGAGAASPQRLAKVLRDAGYGVTFVRLGDLLDRSVLNKQNFDVLMLPDGTYYPAAGKAALVAYLTDGGSFFSAGGYAFDKLVVQTAAGWEIMRAQGGAAGAGKNATAARINTRFGRPGDIMGLASDQIGAFDPSYPLTDVVYAEPAAGQHVFTDRLRIDGALEGFAATALTGNNSPVFPNVHGRWIPLVNARDGYGRLRGAVGALVHHYAGTFAGSSWAFFGATNKDIVSKPPLADRGLVSIFRALIDKTFLHGLTTQWACYRPGETVKLSVKAANHGRRGSNVIAELLIGDQVVHSEDVQLPPSQTREVSVAWQPGPGFHRDFYSATGRLREGDRIIDELQTGFVVWDDGVINNGPRITYRDNYFRIGGRPVFLSGTNQTGMMWYSASENPLVWDRDFAKMRDCGLRLLRILHFSPFSAGGYKGKPTNDPLDLKNRPQKLVRQTDAMVQLAQKHGIALFLSLHDWMDVDLTDEELSAQREWNRFWVQRYKDVPGIIYDIQNEPRVRLRDRPHVKRLFNDFLTGKYGTTEKLRTAWKLEPSSPRLGEISPEPGKAAWANVKTFDANLFKVRLLNRWIEANARGIRQGDPEAIFTVGYLPPIAPADKVLGVEHTTFSNTHWYGPVDELPLQLKLIDRRFEGKSFSLGEFGAQEAHDARVNGQTHAHDQQSITRYLAAGHYALGLGASFVANWCWKDPNDCIFPWGLNHSQDLVSKRTLLAYRAMSLLFQQIEPRYQPPTLYLLVPDNHRLGGNFKQVHAAILNSIRLLFECHVNFNVINEYDLERLPAEARAVIYPVPYCPSDETFERVLAFVEAGGTLYFSGDIAYDKLRQRTRAQRFARLRLPDPGKRSPMVIPPGEANDRTLTSTVGRGHVVFSPVPLEVRASRQDLAVYKRFLALAHEQPIGLAPDDPKVHVFSIPTTGGGTVYVLFNTDAEARTTVQLTDVPQASAITLGSQKPGLVWLSARGELLAVEMSGMVKFANKPLLGSDGQVMLAALDGRDLAVSRQVLILPIEAGPVTLHPREKWRQPLVTAGEVQRGQWRELERWEPRQDVHALTCDVSSQRALNILILAEETTATDASRKVTEMLAR